MGDAAEAPSIHFDITSIDDLVTRLGKASDNIADILEELDRRVAVLDDEWTGEANAAYRTAHADWVAALKEFNSALTSTKRLARAHSAAYAEAEDKISKFFG